MIPSEKVDAVWATIPAFCGHGTYGPRLAKKPKSLMQGAQWRELVGARAAQIRGAL